MVAIRENQSCSRGTCLFRVNYKFVYTVDPDMEFPLNFQAELDLQDMERSWERVFEKLEKKMGSSNFGVYEHRQLTGIYKELRRCQQSVPV